MAKTLADALADRTRQQEEDAPSDVFCHIQLKSSAGNQLARLRSMSLDHLSIESLTGAADLAKHCPILTDLDLSYNQLTSWSEVLALLTQIPTLRLLNIGFNPFEKTLPDSCVLPLETADNQLRGENESAPAPPSKASSGVRTLILNGTHCPWPVVQHLLQHCPSVEELHLSCNDYDYVGISEFQHMNLKRLHFNNNSVSEWHRLEQLCVPFPQLDMLVARANPLRVVHLDAKATAHAEESRTNPPLMSLVSNLVLSETQVSHVDELFALEQRCPGLKELRMQDVPLVSRWPQDVRHEVLIAFLPQLTRLNGSKISEDDMEKAERALVRHYHESADSGDISGRLKERFDSLVEKHGLLAPLKHIDLGPPTGSLTVCLRSCGNSAHRPLPGSPVRMEIPLDSNLITFRTRIAKALGEDPRTAQSLRLYRLDDRTDHWSRIHSRPECSLDRLYLSDNSEIRVQKPLPPRWYGYER